MYFLSFLSCLSQPSQLCKLVKRHFPSFLDSRVSCYFVYLGTKLKKNKQIETIAKLKKNNQIGTIAKWGPTFRVAFDFIVHSNKVTGWSTIIRFINLTEAAYPIRIGDRIPAVFYNSGNGGANSYLHISNALNGKANDHFNHYIDLRKWYHIELAQTKINGTVCEIYNS